MIEWRSRPPQPGEAPYTWFGSLVRGEQGGGGQLEFCHDGSHRTAEAALACARRKVKRLNKAAAGGAR